MSNDNTSCFPDEFHIIDTLLLLHDYFYHWFLSDMYVENGVHPNIKLTKAWWSDLHCFQLILKEDIKRVLLIDSKVSLVNYQV